MTPVEIADLLESSGAAFANTLKALPPEAAAWHPAEGEWCVKECLGHVIESENRGFAGRIRTLLGAENPDLETWDQAAVARTRRDCDREPEQLLDEFEPLRRDSVELVRSLRPDQLTRTGSHPDVGRLTFCQRTARHSQDAGGVHREQLDEPGPVIRPGRTTNARSPNRSSTAFSLATLIAP